jgi:peptidyl-prolyl cis-trans isomerase B (cyclophilin B)
MKKLIHLLLITIVISTLTACGNDDSIETGYDIPKEQGIILNSLPYASYLSNNNPVMTIEVEGMGDLVLQLFPDVAPNTVNSIIAYIQRNDYQDNEFHRVWDGFMIQGGMLDSPYCTIVGEMNNNPDFDGTNDLSHSRGVISMARVGGLYNSQSSQFFI